MRGSGLWFPRFILFLSPKELQLHRSHSKSQHPTHSAEELKARAIMRLVWEKKRKGWKGVWGLVSILIVLSLLNVQSYGQSPSPLSGGPLGSSQIGTIEFQNSSGSTLKKFSSPFIFKCSTGMTCTISGRTVTVVAAGGSGGSSFYQTVQNGGVAVAQEASLNFLGSFSCVDNVGNTSTDCKLSASSAVSHQFVTGVDSSGNYLRARPISTDLSDVSPTPATDGQILIFDGPSSTYIPGDPRVQGLAADGATTVLNPVEIGGYDTAGTPAIHRAIFINSSPSGTEYGEVVRTIPSGTQTVSVSNFPATQPVSIASSVTVTQAIGTNLHTVLDSGTTTVTQATGTDLHTVVDSAPTTAVTAASLPLPTGASTSANQSTVKAASTASVAADTSSVVQISPNQPQLTTPLNIQGGKTNNNAAPGATNIGTLPSIANAAPPSVTEGNQSALSADLAGNLRVYNHPPNALGCYMVNGRTGIYTAQPAGAPLFSFRWTSSTALAVIMRVAVTVATTTATNVVGNAERELVIARSFTVSDTGGTAVVLTGNNQKMRTSQATSAVGDMRFASNAQLTAGTRTLDANPISSSIAILPLLFTGIDIGSGGVVTTTTAVPSQGLGGREMVALLSATTGQDYPIVLAQNEGFLIRIGKDAQPTAVAQQTYAQITWCEVPAY